MWHLLSFMLFLHAAHNREKDVEIRSDDALHVMETFGMVTYSIDNEHSHTHTHPHTHTLSLSFSLSREWG